MEGTSGKKLKVVLVTCGVDEKILHRLTTPNHIPPTTVTQATLSVDDFVRQCTIDTQLPFLAKTAPGWHRDDDQHKNLTLED